MYDDRGIPSLEILRRSLKLYRRQKQGGEREEGQEDS
jgi:hypothetical protein